MSQVSVQPAVSPIHERSYAPSQKIRTVEDNLRELRNNSNLFPPLYSDPKSEDIEWNTLTSPHLISPMSDQRNRGIYGTSPTEVGGVYQAHPGIGQRPSREQLPPLSSIFATPRQGTLTRASYLDRSPTFPILPAQNIRQSSTPHQQSLDLSYPQGCPSTSKPISSRSYDARSTSSELPPPPRHMHINRIPPTSSPHSYETQRSPQENGCSNGLRTQLPTSRSSSSPQSERPYQDYFISTRRDASFRPQLDQQPVHPRREETVPAEAGRDMPQNTAPTAPRYHPPAASTTAFQEQDTTKDALGPKIWTGTQFLPRFVRQAEIPGEGLCYFYDDGTHCKTHIDGEAVNAHWGVTKAGKPRKRLAIACITCREKKIKCDPDYPRCIQCEKFGRVCKFKNA
jgi:Fungal Zn(2)-Cys(6) binuclear cluster domain